MAYDLLRLEGRLSAQILYGKSIPRHAQPVYQRDMVRLEPPLSRAGNVSMFSILLGQNTYSYRTVCPQRRVSSILQCPSTVTVRSNRKVCTRLLPISNYAVYREGWKAHAGYALKRKSLCHDRAVVVDWGHFSWL